MLYIHRFGQALSRISKNCWYDFDYPLLLLCFVASATIRYTHWCYNTTDLFRVQGGMDVTTLDL